MTSSPLRYTYTPEFHGILEELRCSLIVSAYHSGKVITLSSGANGITHEEIAVNRPIGVAVNGDKIAIAAKDALVILEQQGSDRLLPTSTYRSGEMNYHDMAWGADELWMVNTKYCCLSTADPSFQIVPRWQPSFISASRPEDRCHLNGLAMYNGEPLYTTALGATDTPEGWRSGRSSGGVIIHVPTGEIAVHGLSMPHSPRIFDGTLYALNSGTGELLLVDPQRGTFDSMARLPGFARGMARCADYLFVGLSKLRQSRTLRDLPLDEQKDQLICGIAAIQLSEGRVAALCQFIEGCDELYDVHMLPCRDGRIDMRGRVQQT